MPNKTTTKRIRYDLEIEIHEEQYPGGQDTIYVRSSFWIIRFCIPPGHTVEEVELAISYGDGWADIKG